MLERVFGEGRVTSRRDGSVHDIFPVGIPRAEVEALERWVVSEGARSTLEIGLGYGISTLSICAGLLKTGADASNHVAIDPNQASRFADCGLQLLEDAGVRHLVEHLDEESMIALPRLLGSGRHFDLAFVDANHRFDGVFVDLVYLARLVRGGGVIVVDDYQLPAVAKAVSFCVTNLGWSPLEVSAPDELHCWAVLRLPQTPVTRNFDHYRDF